LSDFILPVLLDGQNLMLFSAVDPQKPKQKTKMKIKVSISLDAELAQKLKAEARRQRWVLHLKSKGMEKEMCCDIARKPHLLRLRAALQALGIIEIVEVCILTIGHSRSRAHASYPSCVTATRAAPARVCSL
jgi:hypothetical protein